MRLWASSPSWHDRRRRWPVTRRRVGACCRAPTPRAACGMSVPLTSSPVTSPPRLDEPADRIPAPRNGLTEPNPLPFTTSARAYAAADPLVLSLRWNCQKSYATPSLTTVSAPSVPTAPVIPTGTCTCTIPPGQPHDAGTLTATSGSVIAPCTTGMEYASRLTHQWSAARRRGSSRQVVAGPSGVFHGDVALNGHVGPLGGGVVVVGAGHPWSWSCWSRSSCSWWVPVAWSCGRDRRRRGSAPVGGSGRIRTGRHAHGQCEGECHEREDARSGTRRMSVLSATCS